MIDCILLLLLMLLSHIITVMTYQYTSLESVLHSFKMALSFRCSKIAISCLSTQPRPLGQAQSRPPRLRTTMVTLEQHWNNHGNHTSCFKLLEHFSITSIFSIFSIDSIETSETTMVTTGDPPCSRHEEWNQTAANWSEETQGDVKCPAQKSPSHFTIHQWCYSSCIFPKRESMTGKMCAKSSQIDDKNHQKTPVTPGC